MQHVTRPAVAGHSVTTEITGWNWTYLTITTATSLKLGSRLQWLGQSTNLIIYNDICQTPAAVSPTVAQSWGAAPLIADDTIGDAEASTMVQTGRTFRETYGCAKVFDLQQMQCVQTLDQPIYSVSPDGQTALSFDLNRMEKALAGKVVSHCTQGRHKALTIKLELGPIAC